MKPVNQKSVYHSYADVYEKLMNDEIPAEKAEVAGKLLDGMSRAYALEIKRTELEKSLGSKAELRIIEMKAFDNIPIE